MIARIGDQVAAMVVRPPLALGELHALANAVEANEGIPEEYHEFVVVAVGNAVWRETVAGVPCSRRILLLPQCLRDESACPARCDKLGLLCENCGCCPIGRLQAEAEQLGYVVLVAEGTSVVTQLLGQGQVDAVIGVSCLDVFERAFPHMLADAIPGIAVPLLRDGCRQTAVDEGWLRRELHLGIDGSRYALFDLTSIHQDVCAWFEPDTLERMTGAETGETAQIARQWLEGPGKRWRPFLLAAVYRACRPEDNPVPEPVIRLAIAVECFHKASLIHDDIEDNDDQRYGNRTLHCQYGIPTALNVGDYLIGEGYAQIAAADLPGVGAMTSAAAEAHKILCLGQGEELAWMRSPAPPSVAEVLRIFARKTAPAFEVALRLAALAADLDSDDTQCLGPYSRALGIGYQIQDDLGDGRSESADGDLAALRPSLLLALAYEAADSRQRETLSDLINGRRDDESAWACLRERVDSQAVRETARRHFEHHRNQALRCVAAINNTRLKLFLQRLTNRILAKS
ncbi:MAG: polyprenyl synthetase family protein [bacterium]